ncbi:MAG: T9SS C-terminal target domain-containing protein, partial [Bacteroidetes bacterium]
TNATLFLSNIGFADAGRYTVRVSNEAGEVTSAPATLTITSLTPVFLTQPVPVEVRVGEEAVLTAETAGLAPLARQWLRNGVPLADDGRIQGATTDTLRIAPAQVADGGTYALQLSNPRGTLTSEAVLLTVTPSTATTDEATLPTTFTLDQNYPNPFNPITSIRYGLPEPTHVRLELYTLLGQRVAVLADTDQAAGWHTVTVDGRHLASGAYLYVLHAGDHTSSRTLVLL